MNILNKINKYINESETIEINTVKEAIKYARKAKEIVIQPRFGTSEDWIKISKKEAINFLNKHKNSTASSLEMISIAEYDDKTLYIG